MELVTALIDLGTWNLIGLAGIVLIGLPHGALDGAVAMHLGIVQRFSDLARFMIVYIALAALVVVTWTVAPSISLILFLIISLLHFGAGDVKNGQGSLGFAEALAHGGLAIVGISQFHRSEVNEIFAYLTNQDTATVWLAIDILTVGVIVAIITCIVQASKNPKWATTVLELLLLGLFTQLLHHCLASPSTSVVFTLPDISERFTQISRETVASGSIKNQAILFTVISWIAAGVAFWMFADFADPGPTILRITFIGLAALTVPHMILIDGITKLKGKSLTNNSLP